ncbi:replication factor-a protein [Fragilariopsis cylindrus CCMP1102]|uniref:Replication protein A subunit n=1 Tax=Fragilariopsis cylindrus CCMP1102 TaxID=635003 RepID=A0A1E7F2H4_9STRA|nr:replication factor-a protein [Fragilariopsis cylindrus CCMP1102]|eukprot:OEU12326.1 replication factor-a protein [Fragilariopsis cylindrus CCMP1102]
MSAQSLTQDAVRTLIGSNEGHQDSSFSPVCQIINIKNVTNKNDGNDRYRIILSDGVHYIQGMVATQLKHLMIDGSVKTHNIIRINEYMVNTVQAKKICIILNLDVIDTSPSEKIGEPVDIEKVGAINLMANSSNNNSSSSTASAAPIGPRITPISQLNMYQNRFTIKARVTSKGDIKTWSNAKGEGCLLSMEVLDASGSDIRITMFKEAVEKWNPYFHLGEVYTITGGRLKVANMQYNTCKSQFEMTIDVNTEIAKVEDSNEIKTQMFEFIKIGSLEEKEEKSYVDIIGIVQEVGEVQTLTSKRTGNELVKSDVTLIDDTGVQVRLTLWGTTASSAKEKLAGEPVVAFRRARVSDYGGKTLSGGDVFVEPDVPETEDIRRWWKSQGSRSAPVKSLSSSGGAGGKMDSFNDRKTIADIKNQHLGQNNEKGDYLTFKAHFTFLKKDKEGGAWYTACPNKEDPCRNRCKINQSTDGSYACDRCHGNFPTCDRKWIFSGTVADGMASTWVSVFDEQGQQLLGTTANAMFEQYESNQDEYDATFARGAFTEWVFKCRVKQEMVNDEPRIKTQVVRMEPVNYVTECRDMIAALERM